MTYALHLQRVIDEKAALDDKAKKLSAFIGENPLFEQLDAAEQEYMKVLNDLMWQYFVSSVHALQHSPCKPMTTETNHPPTGKRPLYEIARDIRKAWPRPHFAALLYLDALWDFTSTDEMLYHETGASVVRGFLANAQTFRGPTAKALKEELKEHLKD